MSLTSLERAILAELRQVTSNKKLKLEDIMAWQTGSPPDVQKGEKEIFLPDLAVYVVYKEVL
jgi:hypothetical protein